MTPDTLTQTERETLEELRTIHERLNQIRREHALEDDIKVSLLQASSWLSGAVRKIEDKSQLSLF